MAIRIPNPPSSSNAELYRWMQEVTRLLNSTPAMSYISTTGGPNVSGISGERGTIAIEQGSSRTTRLWIKSASTGTNNWRGILSS